MSDYDFIQLYKKLEVLDRELKELRREVGEMKWYQQHGTTGAVAYSAKVPIGITEEEWRESFK